MFAPLTIASMWPRHFRSGSVPLKVAFAPFLKLQCGHVISDVDRRVQGLQARKGVQLQCGHVISDVDRRVGARDREAGRKASMWPRHFRRGSRLVLLCQPLLAPGFNVATSFQTWIEVYGGVPPLILEMLQCGHVISDVDRSLTTRDAS